MIAKRSSSTTRTRTLPLFTALLLSLVWTGCRTDFGGVVDDTGRLYHYNWWNFYRRGSARLRAGQVREAAEDFERCLGIRPGAKYGEPRDMWRARTYGMHFLEGYFPNRELGVCLHRLGRQREAADYLETSLEQAPSGRAKHYLNEVNRKLLSARAPVPPTIALAAAAQKRWTRERRRAVTGVARAEGLVERVAVNGVPAFSELATAQRRIHSVVDLRAGTNLVEVQVTDLVGRHARERVVWIADWLPPAISIDRIEQDGGQWLVEGVCDDDHGLASVTVDGKPVLPRAAAAVRSCPVRVRFTPPHRPAIVAQDLAGNRLATSLSPALLAPPPRTAPRTASAALRTPLGSALEGERPASRGAWLKAAAEADTATDAPTALPTQPDTPVLALSDDRPVIKIFTGEALIDGVAAAADGLLNIEVAGRELLPPARRGVVRSYFARRVPVEEGTNSVLVVARDVRGRRTERRLTVIRRQPEYRNEKFRLTLAFPPLAAREPIPSERIIKHAIQAGLLEQPARFHLVEREEGWPFILRELKIAASSLSDPRVAMRIDKLLPADKILAASLLPYGSGLTIYAKIVDTETGEVVDVDVYTEKLGEQLDYHARGLVMKIRQRFPLLMGRLLAVNGRSAEIGLGRRHGLSPHSSFIAVRNPSRGDDIRGGTVYEHENRFVELVTRKVREETGTVRIHPAAGGGMLKEGDYVYAR